MILHYTILLFLGWPLSAYTEDADLNSQQEIFDQLATASENIAHAVQQMNESSMHLREQLSSVLPSSLGAPVYYENSNGFVPIIPSSTSRSYNPDSPRSSRSNDLEDNRSADNRDDATNAVSARDNSDTSNARKLEEDLAYSSEARIFLNFVGSLTNRRSFDFQADQPNEFELLKVNNDTPAVANYKDFYENARGRNVNAGESETDESTPSSRRPGALQRGRGIGKYGNGNPYAQYYTYSGAQDAKRTAYEQEKVVDNYQPQDTANHDGHGQSATKQNAAPASVPSSSRTNHKVGEPDGTRAGTYDSSADSSKTSHHRFSRPVVVAEPNNYKVDANLNTPPVKESAKGSDNDYKTSRNLETSSSSETSESYDSDDSKQRSYNRAEDSRNLSDESVEYTEYIERPRIRIQKIRRRPVSHSDSTRKLPKEHRVTVTNDSVEEQQDKPNKHSSSKPKSQRYRIKTNPWANDPIASHVDESVEEVVKVYDSRKGGAAANGPKVHHASRPKQIGKWSQISPNLEISHSSGIELDEVEKPTKFVVPVNFVPVANFDHATALGSSQGFDLSNAMLQNIMAAAPILSTPHPLLAQNLALSKNSVLQNVQNLGVSTPVPDVIVGQSSFHSPQLHTLLLSQPGGQNKLGDTLRTNYLSTTLTPLFAVTSSLSPSLQSMQDNVTPRTAFAMTPTSAPILQQLPVNQLHAGMQQHLIVPQPTFQTFLPTSFQTSPQYQIQVNPHGLQGQNLINHNLQAHSLPTIPTQLSGQLENKGNLVTADSQDKKIAYSASGGNFLASASLTVDQDLQKQATNIHSYYLQPTNLTPKTKTFVQATQVLPTIIQPGATLSGLAVNAQHLIPSHVQVNKQTVKSSRLPNTAGDNVASSTNQVNAIGATASGTAHLPNVGTKNVEILNPNIKLGPIDGTVNTFQTMRYPTTVLTTPIPIFSTVTPIIPHTISLQNYVDSLTESGAKAKQIGNLDLKPSQNQERPVFNPINFVPNVDIIKNQKALNNKVPTNEPVQQGLSLVPVMPGGNFFKPSYTAQNELVLKPKLASDLQQYAEEMFKESLKTMYNSQKWNNDKRQQQANGPNNTEATDMAKLQLELQKLRASISDNKYRDLLEGYQSENKGHVTDAHKPIKPDSSKKKPEALLTLEHLLKTRPSAPTHVFHGGSRPSHKFKSPGESGLGPDFHDEIGSASYLTEYLTPPRLNGFYKSPYHDKSKKRPGSSRFKNAPRKPPMRSPLRPSSGPDTSSSNVDVYLDGLRYHRSPFERDTFDHNSRRQSFYDAYPVLATSSPEVLNNLLRELKTSNSKDYGINHPRMHNLLGLLMKNKQLPPTRTSQNYFRDKEVRPQFGQYFENNKHQLLLQQPQFYDDTLRDYFDRADVRSQRMPGRNRKVYSRKVAA